ncbi:hypothetical protein [Nonomuraea guangzhouensis]|uniref:Alpha/beta hydrolase n=1 Tax=Nonomuraea guangzhouensis TaxID=1291555 RepID=A0ABW4GTX2_9ACTN|nr:hypothetical protein [Nonomuraea guangzhouensis]
MARIVGIDGCDPQLAPPAFREVVWLRGLQKVLGCSVGEVGFADDFSHVSLAGILSPRRSQERTGADSNMAERMTFTGAFNFAAQLLRYLSDVRIRRQAREHVADGVTDDTRVVIAHSLGSVAAYEALTAMPVHNVELFITLGSPLGMRGLFFDRLESTNSGKRKKWPQGLGKWVNIAGRRDPITVVRRLRPLFGSGDQIEDVLIDCAPARHWVGSYLTSPETGRAIVEGFAASLP